MDLSAITGRKLHFLAARERLRIHDPEQCSDLAEDIELRQALLEFDVGELIDLIDSAKQRDGERRSIAVYRAWISLGVKPNQLFAAWYNLGVQLTAAGSRVEAAAAFKAALAAQANLYSAAINAGLCHEELGDPEGALRIWADALQSDGVRTTLLNHQGRLLETLKRYDEAEQSFVASLLTNPRQTDVIHHWIGVRTKACFWPVLRELPSLTADVLLEGTSALSVLALSDSVRVHDRSNASWIAHNFPPAMPRLSPAGGYAHRKLRIGYMSSDYCRHPMAYLVADLFEQHRRDAFEIFGYCSTKDDGSAVRHRVLSSFDKVTFIRDLSDAQAAEAIRSDEIDILIDLNGLTLGSRLGVLRWRPAPVQMTYLGYNGAIPMEELDYILADRYVLPPEAAADHRPPPLYLPSCYQANDRYLEIASGQTRQLAKLPEDRFVYCCFSNNYKITESVFAAWIEILKRTEGSVLWLYADNAYAKQSLTKAFIASGLGPNRLYFAERSEPEVYRARLALADVFLDTFPYNAGTTASDALRVGLPIVTLSGQSFISRMAGSLLQAVGAREGIVETIDAYVDLAVQLARDPDRYKALRRSVGGDAWMKTLGDTPGFTRHLEAALLSVAITAGEDYSEVRTRCVA